MLSFNIELQRDIISAALDDFTPNSALSDTCGGQYGETPGDWREVVIEFIHTMLKAELVKPLPGIEGYEMITPEELCELLRTGDQKNGFDVELLWDVIHFAGTEKLMDLLSSMGLANWEAWNGDLSLPLESTLTRMGVFGPSVDSD